MATIDAGPAGKRRGRRGLLAGAAAASAGLLAATRGGGRSLAGNGDPILAGAGNSATETTTLTASLDGPAMIIGSTGAPAGSGGLGVWIGQVPGVHPSTAGVYAKNVRPSGVGISGEVNQGTGVAVVGKNTNGGGTAIRGIATNGSGVRGEATGGFGVHGRAPGGGRGVFGEAGGSAGTGVVGTSEQGIGVRGLGALFGVLGTSGDAGVAGNQFGDGPGVIGVTGFILSGIQDSSADGVPNLDIALDALPAGVAGIGAAVGVIAIASDTPELPARLPTPTGVVASAPGAGGYGVVAYGGRGGVVGIEESSPDDGAPRGGDDDGLGLSSHQFGVLGLVQGSGDAGVGGTGPVGVMGIGFGQTNGAATDPLPGDAEGIGVVGAGDNVGVYGGAPATYKSVGVWGSSGIEPAVADAPDARTGVLGTGFVGTAGIGGSGDLRDLRLVDSPIGVIGIGHAANSTGVSARSDTGVALEVAGVNRFSQVGRATFVRGRRNRIVSGLKVTPNSGVVVTLNGPTGPGVYLQSARVTNAGKLFVTLNVPAKRLTKFTYFIVDGG